VGGRIIELGRAKERRGYSHLKEEALDRTMWRASFGRGFGPVVRQTAEWMIWNVVKVDEMVRNIVTALQFSI
jgi:hypothetical protein